MNRKYNHIVNFTLRVTYSDGSFDLSEGSSFEIRSRFISLVSSLIETSESIIVELIDNAGHVFKCFNQKY